MAVNDAMDQILWTHYFLERQNFAVKNNIVHQDNMLTMRMAKIVSHCPTNKPTAYIYINLR